MPNENAAASAENFGAVQGSDHIPDREILSVCLDLLLEIAGKLRGTPALVELRTARGGTVRVYASTTDRNVVCRRGSGAIAPNTWTEHAHYAE